MKSMLIALTTAACLVSLSACRSDAESAGTSNVGAAIQPLLGTWTLDSIGTRSFAQLVPQDVAAKKPTLDISADGQVSGFAGVNRLISTLSTSSLGRGEFVLSPIGTTMMLGPDYLVKLEKEYLGSLARARYFTVDGGKLTLTDGASQVMQFVRGK